MDLNLNQQTEPPKTKKEIENEINGNIQFILQNIESYPEDIQKEYLNLIDIKKRLDESLSNTNSSKYEQVKLVNKMIKSKVRIEKLRNKYER